MISNHRYLKISSNRFKGKTGINAQYFVVLIVIVHGTHFIIVVFWSVKYEFNLGLRVFLSDVLK